ncbi:hypothetical protein [Actibacterium sp.]|uniref:hypothetical protein n=1 Tax=Actibacterium sp. TaxID=1872125 RepID=UPI003565946D
MISVEDALARIFDLTSPTDIETVPLALAAGRVLAEPAVARRDQPPFDASAMDGYALKSVEADVDAQFMVIGTSAAGHGFDGKVGPGQTVRIFTGAPMPQGADRVVLQEDVTVSGNLITLNHGLDAGPHVRPSGADFKVGDQLDAPRLLSAGIAHLGQGGSFLERRTEQPGSGQEAPNCSSASDDEPGRAQR